MTDERRPKKTLHCWGRHSSRRALCGRLHLKLATTGPSILDWPERDRKICQTCVRVAKARCREAGKPETVPGLIEALGSRRGKKCIDPETLLRRTLEAKKAGYSFVCLTCGAGVEGRVAWWPGANITAEENQRLYVDGFLCPVGGEGDRLWVRECWRPEEWLDDGTDGVRFRADNRFVPIANTPEAARRWVQVNNNKRPKCWRPSIHMPRWACRLFLRVVEVRVERLQDISVMDAIAEGVTGWATKEIERRNFDELGHRREVPLGPSPLDGTARGIPAHINAFAELWDTINQHHAKWEANPWVWVVEFEVGWLHNVLQTPKERVK